MKIIKLIKKNLFLTLVLTAYIVVFIFYPELAFTSVKNSGYYIKEMLMIMPVIFILTALLDTWVPKDKIMKYLGKEAKVKGLILALVLGSVSAGPIYAAFPMCVMLHKKGATIRNLVVILSSWAVIKIPMLLNEVKFLGIEFMVNRWILTVFAIIVFSWITSKIVKDEDVPVSEDKKGLFINKDACIGCTLCVKNYPEVFEMENKKVRLKSRKEELDVDKLNNAIASCPVQAIEYVKSE